MPFSSMSLITVISGTPYSGLQPVMKKKRFVLEYIIVCFSMRTCIIRFINSEW